MSIQNFKTSFVNPIVKKLEAENTLREVIQKDRLGQVLVLKDLEAFRKVLSSKLGIDTIDPNLAKKVLAAGRAIALGEDEVYATTNKRKYNAILRKIKSDVISLGGLKHRKQYFIVWNFHSAVDNVKRAMLEVLQKGVPLSDEQRSTLTNNIHKGHGVSGLAVSEVEISRGIRQVHNFLQNNKLDIADNLNKLKDSLSGFIYGKEVITEEEEAQLKSLFSTYKQQVDRTGKVRADYVSIITFQEGKKNVGPDAKQEKRLKDIFRQFISNNARNILDQKGSSTLKEKIETVLIDASIPKGSKTAKVKVKRNPKQELQTLGKVTKVFPAKTKKSTTPVKHLRDPATGRFISKAQLKAKYKSKFNILAMINAKLPEQVAKNMIAPRLVYRTGRFANSVRATDVQKTGKGFTSIGYTYMRDPYTVFEMGLGRAPWATPERDPRKIIDLSIREIAQNLAIGRFFTRRV